MPYDPSSPAYVDGAALAKEWERVATICHECRLCFNLCPSFPNLFDRVDAHDGDVSALKAPDYESVADDCYGCKLCYVKCPYTPPHERMLDFPALVTRDRAARVAREGVPRRERFLANVDRAAFLGRWTAPLANLALRLPPFRWLLEKTHGVHRRANLPRFALGTFSRWFRKRRKTKGPPSAGAPRVAVFPTCYVDANEPRIGKAMVAVLEHNGADVAVPVSRCCGMPWLDAGDVESARRQAGKSMSALAAAAREGMPVLVPQPTCLYMVKEEWPRLVPGADADAVARAARDPASWLLERKAAGELATDFREGAVKGKVGYHFACHLQALGTGMKSRELVSMVPGVAVTVTERCSGHDGTYAYKRETREQSLKQGAKLFRAMTEEPLDHVVSDCPLAARQIAEGAPSAPKPLHPMVLLARAYGLPEGDA
jgi:Fe-S oxidoreductase